MKRRPQLRAANPVEPEPANGSSTMSPGREYARMSGSSAATGFSVGCEAHRRRFGFCLAFDDFDGHAGGFEKVVVTRYLFASLPAAISLVCEGKKHAFFRP